MKTVYIYRNSSDDKQTLGVLIAPQYPELFVCKTLELPWLNNIQNISCYPKGEYLCKWTRSNRLSALAGKDVYTYEILNVPDRSGVRIHSANYFSQLKGCTALGNAHKDINIDGKLDLIHSGATVEAFNQLMDKEDFKLIVGSL